MKTLTKRNKILLVMVGILAVIIVAGVVLTRTPVSELFGGAHQEEPLKTPEPFTSPLTQPDGEIATPEAPKPPEIFESPLSSPEPEGLAPTETPSAAPEAVQSDWLEPLGLNITDMVGWVPESDLAGAIIQYTPGYGILRYVSGSRDGNTVTITAKAYPRFFSSSGWNGSLFGCLGQGARIDELGSVSPATRLRVYTPDGQEVTQQVGGYYYQPAGQIKPIRSPKESEQANLYRYWESDLLSTGFDAEGALVLPANMGCELLISYQNYAELTLVFRAEVVPAVSVTVLGRQSFQFPVYFGPGYVGHFDALRDQLDAACTTTPSVVANMSIPTGTNYFLFNYPPMPIDPYTAFPSNPSGNLDRPTGVTYRFQTSRGLTVDHVVTMGLPASSHWVDQDQAASAQYLPYANGTVRFNLLETLLPPGIGYDPCMVNGGCSSAKLAQICSTAVSAQMIYLQVDRIQSGLSRVPLQMPGPTWNAAAASSVPGLETAPEAAAPAGGTIRKAYLPLLVLSPKPTPTPTPAPTSTPAIEPDDLAGCSSNGGCGWFTSDGRMVDYIPMP